MSGRQLEFSDQVHPEDDMISAPKAAVASLDVSTLPIFSSMPDGFDLKALLMFVPDIRLKHALAAAADEALAIDVTQPDGLARADAALDKVKGCRQHIERGFKEPKGYAFTLHKRLTGLESDFLKADKDAPELLGQRIYSENKKRELEAQLKRESDQALANQEVRASATEALADAKKHGAPAPVIAALSQQAKGAIAPPVPVSGPPPLQRSTIVTSWTARFKGDPETADPNPDVEDMNKDQQKKLKKILLLIANGKLPLRFSAGLDWGYINDIADEERKTFEYPELEAFEVGSVRAKPRRGR